MLMPFKMTEPGSNMCWIGPMPQAPEDTIERRSLGS